MKKTKIKERIFKFLLINSALALLYILLCAFLIVFFSWAEITHILYDTTNYALIIFMVFGWAMILYSLLFNVDVTPKTTKPIEKELFVASYEDFIKNVSDYLITNNFKKLNLITDVPYQIKIFYNLKRYIFFKRIDFIFFLKKDVLEKNDLNKIDEELNKLIEEKCFEVKPNTLSFSTIICVNKNSPEFKKYITNNTMQSYDIFKLLVGISYEDSKIYIAGHKDAPAIAQYKKLKKFFLKLIEKCNY